MKNKPWIDIEEDLKHDRDILVLERSMLLKKLNYIETKLQRIDEYIMTLRK